VCIIRVALSVDPTSVSCLDRVSLYIGSRFMERCAQVEHVVVMYDTWLRYANNIGSSEDECFRPAPDEHRVGV
jgi:hypothetical protein